MQTKAAEDGPLNFPAENSECDKLLEPVVLSLV